MRINTLLNVSFLNKRSFSISTSLRKSDDFNELNSFYSDLFQHDSSINTSNTNSNQLSTELNEIEELNEEIKTFFNTDTIIPDSKPSLKTRFQTTNPLIVISNSNDPIKNLSLEELLFQNSPLNAKRLMFYVNNPCVVIGKNQNPYKEVNLKYLRDSGIPLLRRKSGGGTVVHDLGNVNYSYITTRQDFDRHFLGGLIINELNKSGLLKEELKLNHKSDIITSLNEFKISGSAFKISKGKSLHHGTMLLNSDLKRLGLALKRPNDPFCKAEILCNSIDSIPSKVSNLNIDNKDFIDVVTNGFLDLNQNAEILTINEDEIELENEKDLDLIKLQDEFKSWEWTFGKTPNFNAILIKNDLKLNLSIIKGLITKLEVLKNDDLNDKYNINLNNLNNVINSNEGLRFDSSEIINYIYDEELKEWFQKLV